MGLHGPWFINDQKTYIFIIFLSPQTLCFLTIANTCIEAIIRNSCEGPPPVTLLVSLLVTHTALQKTILYSQASYRAKYRLATVCHALVSWYGMIVYFTCIRHTRYTHSYSYI